MVRVQIGIDHDEDWTNHDSEIEPRWYRLSIIKGAYWIKHDGYGTDQLLISTRWRSIMKVEAQIRSTMNYEGIDCCRSW